MVGCVLIFLLDCGFKCLHLKCDQSRFLLDHIFVTAVYNETGIKAHENDLLNHRYMLQHVALKNKSSV